ncbi:XRE family transcriptional regulator [Variovorax sp. WS11]|uniref:helix-turn-helix domain-containing protein n=1 Tax=Variovorax sp. WS11 TaxID=1105204 RepID=UPI000D0DF309|nr:helix-turn-helix transcriptional regulator [Variovorax sp. WS11]NDZ17139.1 helix-turn-helix transcriptional regulator [Variovorax sp. WS11]PSL81252.1 XRE family transcriptional regulator [Variovorax sp. WS11]
MQRTHSADRLALFGAAVQMRRKERGLSQAELADKAKLSLSFISRIERGANPASLDTLFAIADALRTKPSALFLEMEKLAESKRSQG